MQSAGRAEKTDGATDSPKPWGSQGAADWREGGNESSCNTGVHYSGEHGMEHGTVNMEWKVGKNQRK